MGNPVTTSTPSIEFVHADHGLAPEHLAVAESVAREAKGFFVTVVDLTDGCPDLLSALYGPEAGDDPVLEDAVVYEKRNGREGPSRLVDLPQRPCRRMVVVGIGGDKIYTAYGTQAENASPREWWDPTMAPHEAVVAAQYWTEHALSK